MWSRRPTARESAAPRADARRPVPRAAAGRDAAARSSSSAWISVRQSTPTSRPPGRPDALGARSTSPTWASSATSSAGRDGRVVANRSPRPEPALAPPVDRGAQPVRRRGVNLASPDGTVLVGLDPSLVGTRWTLGTATCSTAAAGPVTSRPPATRRRRPRSDPRPTTARLVGIAVAEQTYPVGRGAADAAPPPDLLLFLGLGAVLAASAPRAALTAWSSGARAGSSRPRSPRSPTTARRCCTASARASSRSTPTAGSR